MLWVITQGRGEIMSFLPNGVDVLKLCFNSFLVCIKLSGKRRSSWRSVSWRTRRWHASLSHVSRVTDPRSRIWRSLSDITTHYPMLESQIFLTLFWIWNYMCLYKLRNECLLKKIVQEIIQLYRLYCLYRLYTYKCGNPINSIKVLKILWFYKPHSS